MIMEVLGKSNLGQQKYDELQHRKTGLTFSRDILIVKFRIFIFRM